MPCLQRYLSKAVLRWAVVVWEVAEELVLVVGIAIQIDFGQLHGVARSHQGEKNTAHRAYDQ